MLVELGDPAVDARWVVAELDRAVQEHGGTVVVVVDPDQHLAGRHVLVLDPVLGSVHGPDRHLVAQHPHYLSRGPGPGPFPQCPVDHVAVADPVLHSAKPLIAAQGRFATGVAQPAKLVIIAGGDDDRLRQEVVLFASKIDVDEELSRLKAHLTEVRRVVEKGGSSGKRLDFLMQELNREANTLGAKSVSSEVSKISVEMKVLIEQMREQIQNVL
mgnify:CR=1 FL=1